MSKSLLESSVLKKLQDFNLNDCIPENLYLISDYQLDINLISTGVKKVEDQRILEQLFLALLYGVYHLDKDYLNEYKLAQIAPEVLQEDFFATLEKLPFIVLELLNIDIKHIDSHSFEQLNEHIPMINEKMAGQIESWFSTRRQGLIDLLSNSFSHPENIKISSDIVKCIYNWRTDFFAKKLGKIQNAITNAYNMEVSPLETIQMVTEDLREALLNPISTYSPYYEISHLEAIPMELALEIEILVNSIDPALSNEEKFKLDEQCNLYLVEYLKLVNTGENDRNMILHGLNSFSSFISNNSAQPN